MFTYVQLLNGFEKTLLYKIPISMESEIALGSIIHVPLKNQVQQALVTKLLKQLPFSPTYTIKEIISIERLPSDPFYHTFISKVASYAFTPPTQFYQRIHHFLSQKPLEETIAPEYNEQMLPDTQTILTDEQQAVTTHVTQFIKHPKYAPTLLHGVTGSGKTEVYKKLIQTSLEHNKTVLLLLPEVSLSLQFEHLLQKQLPNTPIVGFHSASKPSEKKAVWQQLLYCQPLVIIGVHQPVLLPIPNLGLIIIDEEHETGFQEKKHPKINSKDIAILRAHTYDIPILLGSATPSLNTLANSTRKNWHYFELKKRFAGSFPTIQKVILSDKKKQKRPFFWISQELQSAIQHCLDNKKQTIIYLNRRGYSFFLLCKNCGFTFKCPHCSVSLTPHAHKTTQELTQLRCHYCDYFLNLPKTCPTCQAPEQQFLKKGIGTQQVVQILETLFPQAKIARADLDTTKKKNSWRETVELFEQGKIDIMVGTKTITKGYHFPNVTLVGIIWADLNLHLPIYHASETTLQQLIQVAGRAGRKHSESHVILQLIQDHPLFDFVDELTYMSFTQQELSTRKELCYPPFSKLITIEVRHTQETIVDKEAMAIALFLRKQIQQYSHSMQVLGPSLPLVFKIKNIEIRHLIIKTTSFAQTSIILNQLVNKKFKSSIFIVPSS